MSNNWDTSHSLSRTRHWPVIVPTHASFLFFAVLFISIRTHRLYSDRLLLGRWCSWWERCVVSREDEWINRERERTRETAGDEPKNTVRRTHQWTLSACLPFSISTCVNLANCQRDAKTNNESTNEKRREARWDEWNSSTRTTTMCTHRSSNIHMNGFPQIIVTRCE